MLVQFYCDDCFKNKMSFAQKFIWENASGKMYLKKEKKMEFSFPPLPLSAFRPNPSPALFSSWARPSRPSPPSPLSLSR